MRGGGTGPIEEAIPVSRMFDGMTKRLWMCNCNCRCPALLHTPRRDQIYKSSRVLWAGLSALRVMTASIRDVGEESEWREGLRTGWNGRGSN
jgi:hypothetical protein